MKYISSRPSDSFFENVMNCEIEPDHGVKGGIVESAPVSFDPMQEWGDCWVDGTIMWNGKSMYMFADGEWFYGGEEI